MSKVLHILRHPVSAFCLARAFYKLGGCIEPKPCLLTRLYIGWYGLWEFSGPFKYLEDTP